MGSGLGGSRTGHWLGWTGYRRTGAVSRHLLHGTVLQSGATRQYSTNVPERQRGRAEMGHAGEAQKPPGTFWVLAKLVLMAPHRGHDVYSTGPDLRGSGQWVSQRCVWLRCFLSPEMAMRAERRPHAQSAIDRGDTPPCPGLGLPPTVQSAMVRPLRSSLELGLVCNRLPVLGRQPDRGC